MTLQKWAIFIMGVYGEIYHFFVGSNWNFVPCYIKKRWHTTWKFQLEKKQVLKKLSPKSVWQTYMKWTVLLLYYPMLLLLLAPYHQQLQDRLVQTEYLSSSRRMCAAVFRVPCFPWIMIYFIIFYILYLCLSILTVSFFSYCPFHVLVQTNFRQYYFYF